MYDHILLPEEICGQNGHHNDARYALFKEHISRVIATATALHQKLPANILLEEQDFIMIGLEALWDCTKGYDSSINPNFWGYARSRVFGSMIDETRNFDPVSRSNRDILKKIECRKQQLEQEFQRDVSLEETCTILGINDEKTDELSEVSSISFVSLDSSPWSNGDSEPDITLAEIIPDQNSTEQISVSDKNNISELDKLIQKLEVVDRSVIRLYFFSGLRLRDIASAMRLTEGRISQILKGALEKLRLMISMTDTSQK